MDMTNIWYVLCTKYLISAVYLFCKWICVSLRDETTVRLDHDQMMMNELRTVACAI